MPAIGFGEDVWANFLWACDLGTVVRDKDGTIWQKRSVHGWARVGHEGDCTASSIAWPVSVLQGGIA